MENKSEKIPSTIESVFGCPEKWEGELNFNITLKVTPESLIRIEARIHKIFLETMKELHRDR